MPTVAAIILAAGQSSRFADKAYKKPFAPLADRPVWLHSTQKFADRADVKQTLVVVAGEDDEFFREKYGANLAFSGIEVVVGGAERSDSVAAALARVSDGIELVAIHDAARPCVEDAAIERVIAAAAKHGAAILAVPVTDTLKRADGTIKGAIKETVSRAGLWAAQTPQVFRREWIVEAYAKRNVAPATDDAELVERLGRAVQLVEGKASNIKLTHRSDLKLAEQILRSAPPKPMEGFQHPFGDDDLWR
jgi:2-C-methyl-D-erythritol 4-phosphate cytidylyltransferase